VGLQLWDDCRAEYEARWPLLGTDYIGLLAGLRALQLDDSSATIQVGLADRMIGRRTWIGHLPNDELAALLGAARHFKLEVGYPDGSQASVANLHRKQRHVRFTAGVAQDAVHRCLIDMKKLGFRRRAALALPHIGAAAASTVSMVFAIGYAIHQTTPGAIWTLLSGAAALACFFGPGSTGSAVPARGRRSYLARINHDQGPQTVSGSRRRLIRFQSVDGTDIVVSLCLMLIAVLLDRWL
jgi:hypothetical protein